MNVTRFRFTIPLLWAALLVVYLPLIQRIPNGSDHYFMIDVGETQVVLNNWGTLHATGYPHYVIIGNLLTDALTAIGLSPLTAAAGVSLIFSLLSLALMYWLGYHLTQRIFLAWAVTFAYGLTRTIWVHSVIAEIYSFGLLILVGLLLLALHSSIRWPGRIYWLALLGGIGVAHHRAIAMAAPALLFAVWPKLTAKPRKIPLILLKALILGCVGFLFYLYLMIRAWMEAAWVYGEPGTLHGLWEQFIGTEASRFIGPATTLSGFLENLATVNNVLITDLTLPVILGGLMGLGLAITSPKHRQAAITFWLSGGVAYGFHIIFYRDILSALILPITLSLVFGWLFLFDRFANSKTTRVIAVGFIAAFCGYMLFQNTPFIHDIVNDPRGLETIDMAQQVPDGYTLMLPWGPRYFAVGYAADIEHSLDTIQLVDHKADYQPAFDTNTLVVPEYIRFSYPQEWWEQQLNQPVYPVAVAPRLITLQKDIPQEEQIPDELLSRSALACDENTLELTIEWVAPGEIRSQDLSVFVHLMDDAGTLIAQDDQIAPVYGWRPVSTWNPGEIIRDIYTLPNADAAHLIRYGLYYQSSEGEFINEFEQEVTVDCEY